MFKIQLWLNQPPTAFGLKGPPMKRSYKQNCALALASDVLCERWTLLIFRELLIRPCRFKDLNDVLIGMGTNLLSNRLKELEQAQLIEKQNPADKRSHYQLTQTGQTVEPIVLQLISWGHSHLSGEDEFSHQPHWDLLAMKALFSVQKFQSAFTVTEVFTLQFISEGFIGWAQASHNGMQIGLGLAGEQIEVKADASIKMNVQGFQKAAQQGELNDKKLQTFYGCFISSS